MCVYIYKSSSGLKALKEALEKRDIKKIPTEDLLKMAEFVLIYLSLTVGRISKNQVQL